MKKSNEFINESVFRVNIKYARLQNKTKELFFKCLNDNKDLEYFKKQLEKLWGNLDRRFLQDELVEYEEMIHEQNLKGKNIDIERTFEPLLALIPLSVIIGVEEKFKSIKTREYNNSLKSYAYKNAKDQYLSKKVSTYTNQVVPYYKKDTNEIARYVQMSTYNSMVHNTNLTRAGWNTTINDAELLDQQEFWIPPHNFSCPYCAMYQGRVLSKDEVELYIGTEATEQEGDILHPNCKCTLTIYDGGTPLKRPQYTEAQIEEQYQIRQKVNSLTLKKEEILTDMKIQEMLGKQDKVDELNQQRNKINASIRELKEALPTAELQRQVVAINR